MTTTTKARATKAQTTTTAVVADPTAILPGEDVDTYMERMIALGTAASHTAAAAAVTAADLTAETDSFRGRIHRSRRAGLLAISHATLIDGGTAPKGFSDVAKALGMSEGNGVTYTGKAHSTLSECYRMADNYDADQVDKFIATWTEVHGAAPTNIRECLTWLTTAKTDERHTKNTVDAYRATKTAKASAKVTAANTAKADREATDKLVDRGYVPGIEDVISQSAWATFTKAQLIDIARLAKVLALTADDRAAAAATKATEEAKAREAQAETGPTVTVKTKARAKVAA